MPGMSGLEVAARINAKAGGPAVVIVSLGATPQLREEALKAGCAGLVSKVDFTAEMPPLIEKLCDGKRSGAPALDQAPSPCARD